MSRTIRIRLLQMHHNIAWMGRDHDHGISHLSPIVIGSGLSPRTVAPNQTDDCSNIITFPTTAAVGATQQEVAILGTYVPSL